MNILNVHSKIIDDYATYTQSFIDIADDAIRTAVHDELAGKRFWPDPLLQFNPAYQKAGRIDALAAQGFLHPQMGAIFSKYELYKHQLDAITLGLANTDFIVTSGTGSGKSLTYMATIFNHILSQPKQQGVVAVIVYPMNALINSQTQELNRYRDQYQRETGEKFPILYGQYTGQEKEEEREKLRQNPPHIILTNYMMLELMLTRQIDKPIITSIYEKLRYLVFDEMHTYRGRQGADVAMLIRRIRAGSQQPVTCIGTSATMVSGGNIQTQREAVAQVAALLFGKPFSPEQIVTESLERSLARPDYGFEELKDAVRSPIDTSAPAEALVVHPVANWLENAVALNREDRILRRRTPETLQAVADRLATTCAIDGQTARRVLNDMLLWISNVNAVLFHENRRYTYLPYRIHQFFGQTGSVFLSLEPAEKRMVTLEAARYRPDSDEKIPLYPVFFSRVTGESFVGVFLNGKTIEPRNLREPKLVGDDDVAATETNAGYLLLNGAVWDPDTDIQSLPETWFRPGTYTILPRYQKRMPRKLWYNHLGEYSHTPNQSLPQTGWFIPAPLLFDPSSGQIFDSASTRESAKLTELGGGGRSTATTITTLSVLTQLKESGFGLRDQKLLSFTDNRQDAALQAGHFNDFVQVVQLRAALYAALKRAPDNRITLAQIGQSVRIALDLPQSSYTDGTLIASALRTKQKQLDDFITYRLLEDAVRSWKVTLPNLEQCALLNYGYLDFDEVVAHPTHWNDLPVIGTLATSERAAFLRTVLDFFRYEYAVTDTHWFVDLNVRENELRSGLLEAWRLERDEHLKRPVVIRVESVKQTSRDMQTVSAAPQSALGKYIRQKFGSFIGSDTTTFAKSYPPFIYQLFEKMTQAGWLSRFPLTTTNGTVHGYALNADIILWELGNQTSVRIDTVRRRSYREQTIKPNQYFQELYKTPYASHKPYVAADHTGQLNNEQRQQREEAFRAEWLLEDKKTPDDAKIRSQSISALFCSPTMELGVDIGGLSVVHMRNAPPNPANYAQRSGRAGRSGQGALVITYCSQSPHDQHYFKHQTDMVAGAVSAPQIELANEDLLRTHLHAVLLGSVGMPTQATSLTGYVDTEAPGVPLHAAVRQHVTLVDTQRDFVARKFRRVIDDFAVRLAEQAYWYSRDWIEATIDAVPQQLDQAFIRWRALYTSAMLQLSTASQSIQTGRLSSSSQEFKDAQRRQYEASEQVSLLKNEKHRNSSLSEFYPYRYLASEGFLPGYNFTKLPVRVFIPTSGDMQGEYLSRPRSIALSEFGPDNVIYHNGNKYRVKQLVTMGNVDSHMSQAKASLASGYLLMGSEFQSDVCPVTNAPLLTTGDVRVFRSLVEMNECRSRAVERITCDEENRLREGYAVETFFSVPGGMQRTRHARILSNGDDLLNIRYFAAASIHHINTGWTAESGTEGFPVHNQSGFWSSTAKIEREGNPPGTYVRVMPWTSITADALFLEPLKALGLDRDKIVTLQYAIKRGIELHFQVEPNEIGVTLVGSKANPSMFLYESAEGSLGIMARFLHDPTTFAAVIRRAITLCRFDDPKYKAPASYDDLLSYYNQPDHGVINRFGIEHALKTLAVCTVEIRNNSGESYDDQYQRLLASYDTSSTMEKQFLDYLYANDLCLPTAAQVSVQDVYVRPDFVYDGRIWIFCDGLPHDNVRVAEQDEEVRNLLRDRGDQVLVWHYRTAVADFVATRPDVFRKIR